MEGLPVEKVAATDGDADGGENGTPVSIENIFIDGDDKKVIVLQSQDVSNASDGRLPDLTDAVAGHGLSQTASDTPEIEIHAEENHSGSAETVSATETYEELNHIDDSAKVDQSNFIMETVQDIETVGDNSEEVIFIDSENVSEHQDQDVQFIQMAHSGQPPSETVINYDNQQIKVSGIKKEPGRPLKVSQTVPQPTPPPRKTTFISREDVKTRFLCPVCEKSFRQKHLLLCHLKLHDSPTKVKSSSVYMSNCTTCGGNVRLTSEQAKLLQERGTEDARIICSTCKLLGHDVMQSKPQSASGPIELKAAYNFNCDMCGCDIKLTDDQLQLVDRKGAENIRIICAPCSTKDQEQIAPVTDLKCTSCLRTIIAANNESINVENPICAECQAKHTSEENTAVENMQEEQVINALEDQEQLYNCSICSKELYLMNEPQSQSDLICSDCKIPERYRRPATVRQHAYGLTPTGRTPRFPHVKGVRELKPPEPKVDGLAVMYKCNSCFCSMQVSEEQKQLLKQRGVSGTKIICSACNTKGKPSSAKKKINLYQCDICLNDMDVDYVPMHDDDDIICETCRKAEQNDSLKKAKVNDLFKCITCQLYLPLSSTQMNKILQRNARPSLQCDPCRRKSLQNDTSKTTSRTYAPLIDYRCDICSLSFGANFDKFTNHFEKIHIPAKTDPSKKIAIRCPICGHTYMDQDKLKLHLKSHRPKKMLQRPCPFCGEKFSKKLMYDHYRTVHSINIENEMYIFKHPNEFKNWKEEIETSTCSKFICSDQKANVIKNMPTINLRCHWSALYKANLVKSRTCVFCPANIEIRLTRNGIYTVSYTKTHVGHDILTDDFSLEEMELMRGYLREGKTIDDIVTELCKDVSEDSEEFARFYQLKNYDEYCLSLKLGDLDLIRKFKRDDFSNDESDGGLSDCDLKADWVDIPKALAFLRDPMWDEDNSAEEVTSVSATIDIEGSRDECLLKFEVPPSAEKFHYGKKKMEVIQRMTDLLNKCSSDEHFDILEIYLSPCEQTLTELTSGKTVEVVGDDEMGVDPDDSDSKNIVLELEDVSTISENVNTEEPVPPLKRAKIETE